LIKLKISKKLKAEGGKWKVKRIEDFIFNRKGAEDAKFFNHKPLKEYTENTGFKTCENPTLNS